MSYSVLGSAFPVIAALVRPHVPDRTYNNPLSGKSSLERDVYTGKNVVDSESHRQKKDSNTPALLSLSCVLPDLTGHY